MSTAAMKDALLSALDDAIGYRQERYVFCADCHRSAIGLCADHDEDSRLAHEYGKARDLIEASPADEAAAGLEGGTQ